MKLFLFLGRPALMLALSLVCVSPGRAQEAGPDEVAAYQAWYAANSQNMAEQAIEAAKGYLDKFPNGQYAAYLKGWMLGPRLKAYDAAVQAKNTDEMIKVGREILKASPTSLGVCYSIAFNLRRLEFLASPENYGHAAEAVEFSAEAIRMIEAGRTIEGGKFNRDASLALLYQIQAMAAGNAKKGAEAIGLYMKSIAADPGNPAFVPNNLLSIASLHREPYAAAVAAYQGFPDADRQAAAPSAEVKAALDKLNATADPLIDAWARFVAFARARDVEAGTRDQVFAGLKAVYSARNAGDMSGLAALIEKLQAEYAPKA